VSEPYEFWINPERQDDEDFYRAYRQNKPGRHFIPVREIDLMTYRLVPKMGDCPHCGEGHWHKKDCKLFPERSGGEK
jgi:hypothetical protein